MKFILVFLVVFIIAANTLAQSKYQANDNPKVLLGSDNSFRGLGSSACVANFEEGKLQSIGFRNRKIWFDEQTKTIECNSARRDSAYRLQLSTHGVNVIVKDSILNIFAPYDPSYSEYVRTSGKLRKKDTALIVYEILKVKHVAIQVVYRQHYAEVDIPFEGDTINIVIYYQEPDSSTTYSFWVVDSVTRTNFYVYYSNHDVPRYVGIFDRKRDVSLFTTNGSQSGIIQYVTVDKENKVNFNKVICEMTFDEKHILQKPKKKKYRSWLASIE